MNLYIQYYYVETCHEDIGKPKKEGQQHHIIAPFSPLYFPNTTSEYHTYSGTHTVQM